MRFTDPADAQSPYLFRCHLLRHEDEEVMGELVVARSGEPVTATTGAGPPPTVTTRHTH